MCREKNLNSAPSPRQPWTLKFNTVSKKRTGHRTGSKENYNRTGLHSNRILYRREGGDWRHGENPLSAFTYYSKQKLCGIHNTDLNTDSNCMTVSAVCRTLIQYALCINLPPVFWRGRRCVSETGPKKRQISMYYLSREQLFSVVISHFNTV